MVVEYTTDQAREIKTAWIRDVAKSGHRRTGKHHLHQQLVVSSNGINAFRDVDAVIATRVRCIRHLAEAEKALLSASVASGGCSSSISIDGLLLLRTSLV